MNAHADLEVLQRRAVAVAPSRKHNRVLGLVLLVALLGVAFVVLRPLIDPAPTVRVVRVRASGATPGSVASTGTSVVAAGWLEADPFPVSVRPLLRGVVRTLEVLEGQSVTKGETVIAKLDNLDARNELDLARAELTLREADVVEARDALSVAQSLLEQKLEPRQRVIDLEGLIETTRRAVARAEARQGEADSAVATAQVDVAAQERVKTAGGSTPVALERARAKLAEAKSRTLQLVEEAARLRKDVARLEALLALAKEGRDDPRALAGDVTNRKAALARAQAAVAATKTRVTVAERNVAHLTVRAPMSGTVLRLNCAPGGLVGPQGEFMGAGEANSTGGLNRLTGAIVTLYDPAHIQARVDVPLGEVAGIEVGTKAQVEVDAAKGRVFDGTVSRVVHEADLNKNTLQVKVQIEAPDGLLRPEMLCRARFLIERKVAPGGKAPAAGENVTWLVPTEAVRDGAVFIYDPRGGGTARRVAVTALGADGSWTRVRGSLGRSSKVVLDAVEDGARIQPQEATP